MHIIKHISSYSIKTCEKSGVVFDVVDKTIESFADVDRIMCFDILCGYIYAD